MRVSDNFCASDRGEATPKKGIFRTLKAYLSKNRLGELLVLRGVITPYELKSALAVQRTTQKPLGQVLVEEKNLSKYQLNLILGRQYFLRACAGLIFMMSLSSASKAKAGSIKDVPAQIALAPDMQSHFTKVSAYPALFESNEKRSGNLSAFTKWTGMFKRFEREIKSSSASRDLQTWRNELVSLKSDSLKTMADRVNRLVNETRYITDKRNWGTSDYWATPAEFLKRGGDCEDFAIAKYTALRMLGVPEERMRVAIVHDNVKNIPHAVLVVYGDRGTYILDNQNKRLVDGDRLGRYRPIFSINRTAWWLHTAPSTTTVVASR